MNEYTSPQLLHSCLGMIERETLGFDLQVSSSFFLCNKELREHYKLIQRDPLGSVCQDS